MKKFFPLRKQTTWSPLLLVVLPAAGVTQYMNDSTHDRCTHAESWNDYWPTKMWKKDQDSSHFEKYFRKHVLTKTGSLMLWPSLEEGLKKRTLDEELIKTHLSKIQQGSILNEQDKLALSNSLSEALYGKGITLQDRQNFLEKYGCVKATTEALDLINKTVTVNSTSEGIVDTDILHTDTQKYTTEKRGIVEIGIGFGQWARLLVDAYNVDIVAFDSMISLPLDPRVHTSKTDGYAQYFYQGKVRLGDATIFCKEELNKRYHLDGRVLMIIFPDPGPMAAECLEAYTASSDSNDTLIYVGEGRGGANGSSVFFDELESVDDRGVPKWQLQETCKLSPFGDKGFERFFVFKRIPRTAGHNK